MPSTSLPPGTLVAGRYRIVRELGRGAMGAVYVAEHVNTGGLWAVKVMLDTHLVEERAARFRREARASARIASEYVVKVTDADIAPELGGAPFLVMELLSGEDLERRLVEHGPLSPSETLEVLTQVARGLEKAHAAGVIHRDLKPENVFLHRRDDGGTIYKVLDFGISKVLRPDGDPASLSATGSTDVMGTPLYMAPEQAAAWHDRVGPQTDVWALALMTIRMLTGRSYWQGQSVPEVFVEIMAQERVPPSKYFPALPAAFDAWFVKSCAFKTTDRFQSVSEQIAALSLALTGQRPSFMGRAAEAPSPPSMQVSTQVITPVRPDASSGAQLSPMVASTAAPVSRSTAPPGTSRVVSAAAIGLMVLLVGAVIGAVVLMHEDDHASVRADTGVVVAAAAPPSVTENLPVVLTEPPPPAPVVVADAAPAHPAVAVGTSHRPVKPGASASVVASAPPPPPAAPPPGPGDLFDTQR